ncbi:Rap1a/Tai family immunity protein [Pseudomonas nunensis]|uniref:Rap1a/Tai family immunity protein n=1 Tax=Pseudomonas nunensis TaxID=2961896 RepID=UPI0034D25FED
MLVSGAVIAEGGDGNELIAQCADGIKAADGGTLNDYYGASFCLGLTQGVRHTMRLLNDELPPLYKTCFPSGITNGQGMRIVFKYLQDHPDRLHEQGSDLVYLAYKTAYPCK